MKNTKLGRRNAGRLTAAAVALAAAFILAVMPAAAATINATDVTIRNTAEDKSDYSNAIGVLNEGDQVTVLSRTTDASGIEWFYIELENGNKGYVKAQWVSNDGAGVPEEESAPAQEAAEQEAAEPETDEQEVDEEDIIDEEDLLDDDWTEEDTAAGTPASENDAAAAAEDSVAEDQDTPAVDNGQAYDPYTDPNAQYVINYMTEEDGTGAWYVYNYDTDKRIRMGDLEKLSDAQNAAQKSAASAGRWRTIACILLILLIALLVFLYIVLRRNSGGPAPSRRNRRQTRAARDDDDDDDEDEDMSEWEDEDDSSSDEDEAAPSKAEVDEDEEDSYDIEDEEEESYDDDSYDEDDEDEEDEEDDEDDYEDDDDEEETPRKGGFFSMLRNMFASDDLDDDYDEDEDDEDEDDVIVRAKFSGTIRKGGKYNIGGFRYQVTGTGSTGTLTICSALKKNATLVIPDAIEINGKLYKVTAISASAFSKNSKLKKVTVGRYVNTIGKKAFFNCKNLKTIVFKGASLKKVGTQAFKNTAKKAKVTTPGKVTKIKKLLQKSGLNKNAKVSS